MEPEYLDIVDDTDNVISRALYQDVYKNISTHRIIHILIFNTRGELLLQKRSKHKKAHPLHWSTSIGGHVRSGETYREAAMREAKEELGIEPIIENKYKDVFVNDKGHKKFLVTFVSFDRGYSFSLDPQEVELVEYKSLPEIKKMIDAGELFHPELLFLLHHHYSL